MKWSKEQQLAIYESNKSILVNAGAGSGKTAVLTERLLQKVKSQEKLENLIVLTFSVLAASEMKERLRKKLQESNDPNCLKELAYIDQANIQTFDSFTNEIVKKYHYTLNIPRNINIVSGSEFKIVSLKILKELFDEYYESNNPSFNHLIKTYTVKDDAALLDTLVKLYMDIRLKPDYKKTLKNHKLFYEKEYVENLEKEYLQMIKQRIKELSTFIDELEKYTSDSKLHEHFQQLCKIYESLLEADSYDELCIIKNLSFPTLPRTKPDEEKNIYSDIYNTLKKYISSIASLLIYKDAEELKEGYQSTSDDTLVIMEILYKLDVKLNEYKRSHNVYDFTDIQFMAIQILEENEEIRESIKNNTHEILIDEYQDTSDVQEYLVGLISNNNVYMVGDVKQSIYRFRNANPNIFKEKYHLLKVTPPNMVIDLAKNFRSRKEVLDIVNLVFKSLMSPNIGGVEYNESHYLNYGFSTYDQYVESSYKLRVVRYDEEKLKTEYKGFNKNELEAFFIGRDILKRINVQKVYDKETNEYRSMTYKDVAILVATKQTMGLYKKIFEYLGIPLKTYEDIEVNDNNDIFAITSMLKTIYLIDKENYEKEPFKETIASFLRSFIINENDQTIAEIVISSDPLKTFSTMLPDIYQKCLNITNMIATTSILEILETCYKTFNVYEKMLSVNDVNLTEYIINYTKNIVSNLINLDYTLKDVIEYFDTLFSDDSLKVKISTNNLENSNNVVKMMTIHASKGLEFPICYFPNLYKEFNYSDLKELITYSKDYQILIPYEKDKVLKKTMTKLLYDNKYHLDEVGERIRLLYVALTRPREQIVLVLPNMKKEINYKINDLIKQNFKSFMEMINSISEELLPFTEEMDLDSLSLTLDYLKPNEKLMDLDVTKNELEFDNIVVNEIYEDEAHPSIIHGTYPSLEEMKMMEKGTHFHKLLEIIDLSNPDFTFLSKEEEKMIKNFINHPFIKDMEIIHTFHEYPFTFMLDDIHINGIIDLIIETNNEYIIIDYKLNDITKEGYQKQLNIYAAYLKSITTKKISAYLYSIVHNEFKKVILD